MGPRRRQRRSRRAGRMSDRRRRPAQHGRIVDEALLLASWGLRLFPLHPIARGRCACPDLDCDRAGKHPRVEWRMLATSHEGRLRVKSRFVV